MPLPGLVLVHGGAHAADCWDLTVEELRRQAPDLPVLAVDLPGRAGKPADLASVSIGDCVESVVRTLIPVDTCHDLMVSEPERLAEILVERCRLHAR